MILRESRQTYWLEIIKKELEKLIAQVKKKMESAAADLNFEAAAELRDQMMHLKEMLRDAQK